MRPQRPLDPNKISNEHLRTAERHIENNLVTVMKGRKCVDGRYKNGTGEIARAGGDMGYVQILLALNSEKQFGMTPQYIFYKVYAAITRDEEEFFYFHTDEYADATDHSTHSPDRPMIGCGHCAKAANPDLATQYGVKAEDMRFLINCAKEEAAQGMKRVKCVTLSGTHAERGAIVVDSDNYSVNANNEKTKTQYFIYDKRRDDAFMDTLLERLGIKGITREDFQRTSDKQTNVTLQQLAGGKPILHAAIDDKGNVKTWFVDYIPLAA